MIKHPLLWLCIAFLAGIVLYAQPVPVLFILAAAGFLYVVIFLLSEYHIKSEKKDLFLLLLPIGFLVGFWCAKQEYTVMLEREAGLERVLAHGEEVYVVGTIGQMTKKRNATYELLLKDCYVGSCEMFERTGFLEAAGKYVTLSQGEVNKEEWLPVEEKTAGCLIGNLLLYVSAETVSKEAFCIGEQVFSYGEAALFEMAVNFGQFDAADYYRQKGITGKMYGIRTESLLKEELFDKTEQHGFWKKITFFQKGKAALLNGFALGKKWIYDVFDSIFNESDAGVLAAMLLGEKAFLDTELKELYQNNGIAHILAVSGLHISLLGMAVYRVILRSPLGRNGAIAVSCLFVFVYGLFTGFSISAERAVLMFVVSMLGKRAGRTYDMPTALGVSAVITLIKQPLAVFSASFLLSYSAVCGILLYQCIEKQLKKKSVLFELFGVSLCIQLVMLPFLFYFFYEVSLYGIFLNLLVLPLASFVLFSGIMTALFGKISLIAGVFFSGAAKVILVLYERACSLTEQLPFSLLLTGRPTNRQMLLYYGLLSVGILVCLNRKKKRVLLILCVPLFVLLLPKSTDAKITFLDVSQGDCIVLHDSRGGAMLVDCGSTDEAQVGKYRLVPYLKANGIGVLEYVVVTHADSDHMNGVRELLEEMKPMSKGKAYSYKGAIRIKRLLLPDIANPDESYVELAELARKKGVEVYRISAQEKLKFGDWKLVCLYPEENKAADSKNNSSLVFLASCGMFDVLLTGDVEKSGELQILQSGLLEQYEIDRIEVLKVAHHGSRGSSSQEFLTRVEPALAVISCAENSRYGHPHEETLTRLKAIGSRIQSTAKAGQLTIRMQGNSVWLENAAGK